jgi:hypothetical protein
MQPSVEIIVRQTAIFKINSLFNSIQVIAVLLFKRNWEWMSSPGGLIDYC